MDYDKKYNEALERARNYHDNSFSFGTKELTEKIFPELAESEDEKIRKEIIAFIEWSLKRGSITTEQRIASQSWFAYLERQKEQKNFRKLYEDIAKSEWFKKAYEGKSLGELISSASWKDDEQKPAEYIDLTELAEQIKEEFEGFRILLKKNGIDYEPQRSYWEGFARLFDSSAREYMKNMPDRKLES